MSVELLQKLGVYIDTEFLPIDLCDEICQAMDVAAKRPAPIYDEQKDATALKPELRSSYYADVPIPLGQQIAAMVRGVQPAIERHFCEKYHPTNYEPPKFLVYEEGNFFDLHKDDQLKRKINISIYLNAEAKDPIGHEYTGGNLILYGLIKEQAFATKGIALNGLKGMLVAYRSETPHEVTKILNGKRYAVVSRFLDQNE